MIYSVGFVVDHAAKATRCRIPCPMIHYTCDRCQRQIDTTEQTRCIVHIEIETAADEPDAMIDEDVDHLSELHELLESLEEESDHRLQADLTHRGHYDLCPECHRRFLRNPLGRDAPLAIGFSNN